MSQIKIRSKEPRQLSPEKTAAILEGGMQEFLTHGYAATSMDRVAAAAGVSKATVYNHFHDKEGLFTALIEQLVQGKFRLVFGSVGEDMRSLRAAPVAQSHPRNFLRQIANRCIDMGASDPQFLNFMRVIIGESGRFPDLARVFVSNIERTSYKILLQYFENCPHLKLADPEATARIFMGAIVHFVIIQEMLHGKDIMPMEKERLIDNLIEAIVLD